MAATGPNGAPGTASGRETEARPRVAVLGTGTMGSAMARNLLRAWLQVDVWDPTPEAAARLAEVGATAHAEPSGGADAAGCGGDRRPVAPADRRGPGTSRRQRRPARAGPSRHDQLTAAEGQCPGGAARVNPRGRARGGPPVPR
jgi:hypothetical protein